MSPQLLSITRGLKQFGFGIFPYAIRTKRSHLPSTFSYALSVSSGTRDRANSHKAFSQPALPLKRRRIIRV